MANLDEMRAGLTPGLAPLRVALAPRWECRSKDCLVFADSIIKRPSRGFYSYAATKETETTKLTDFEFHPFVHAQLTNLVQRPVRTSPTSATRSGQQQFLYNWVVLPTYLC